MVNKERLLFGLDDGGGGFEEIRVTPEEFDAMVRRESAIERPIVFSFEVGLIYGGDPYETRSVDLPSDIAEAVEKANQIALELEGGASHRIMINDRVELPDGRVISLDDLRAMATPNELTPEDNE